MKKMYEIQFCFSSLALVDRGMREHRILHHHCGRCVCIRMRALDVNVVYAEVEEKHDNDERMWNVERSICALFSRFSCNFFRLKFHSAEPWKALLCWSIHFFASFFYFDFRRNYTQEKETQNIQTLTLLNQKFVQIHIISCIPALEKNEQQTGVSVVVVRQQSMNNSREKKLEGNCWAFQKAAFHRWIIFRLFSSLLPVLSRGRKSLSLLILIRQTFTLTFALAQI